MQDMPAAMSLGLGRFGEYDSVERRGQLLETQHRAQRFVIAVERISKRGLAPPVHDKVIDTVFFAALNLEPAGDLADLGGMRRLSGIENDLALESKLQTLDQLIHEAATKREEIGDDAIDFFFIIAA